MALCAVFGAVSQAERRLAPSPPRSAGDSPRAVPTQQPPQSSPASAIDAARVIAVLPAPADTRSPARPPQKTDSTIEVAPTSGTPGPDTQYPFLGAVAVPENARAVVLGPGLSCLIEIRDNDRVTSRQTVGCHNTGGGAPNLMLAEFAHEVADRNPNMHYSLSVQLEGHRDGAPVLRSRMLVSGLIGRARGQRKYESVTVAELNRTRTLVAFTVDDDEYTVTVNVRPRQ